MSLNTTRSVPSPDDVTSSTLQVATVTTTSNVHHRTYTVYATRFLVLFVFALGTILNAIEWICFAPVVQFSQTRFAASNNAINMFSSVFLILYLPGSILSVFLLERYGLRVGICVGTALTVACGVVRYAGMFAGGAQTQYIVVMLGQILGGLAQPFFTNAPSRIAGDWFPASERDIGTVVAAMSNPLGNALGSLIPALIMNGPDDMPLMLLVQAAAGVAILVLTLLLVRDEPPTPPSAAAALRRAMRAKHVEATSTDAPYGAPELNASLLAEAAGEGNSSAPHAVGSDSAAAAVRHLIADFKALFANRNFLYLLGTFSIGLGTFNALLTLLAQWVAPCGYDDTAAGIAGAALLGAGLLGAVVIGVVLEKTRAYVTTMKAGIVTTLLATLLVLAAQRGGNEALLIGSFGAMGAVLIPLLPVALENAAECTYPIPEDNSAALLLIGGQFVGLALTYAMSALLDLPPTTDCSSIFTPMAGMLLGCMVLAALCLLPFRKDYRRQAAEKRVDDVPDVVFAVSEGSA